MLDGPTIVHVAKVGVEKVRVSLKGSCGRGGQRGDENTLVKFLGAHLGNARPKTTHANEKWDGEVPFSPLPSSPPTCRLWDILQFIK